MKYIAICILILMVFIFLVQVVVALAWKISGVILISVLIVLMIMGWKFRRKFR